MQPSNLRQVRGSEKTFKKDLEKLVRISKRKLSTNVGSRALQLEFRKQIEIAFKLSEFPEDTREDFEDVYGRMLLAVGFKFSRTKSKAGTLEEKKTFTGFSIGKALQYLDPYLPPVYDYSVCEAFKALRDGGVIENDETLYEKEFLSLAGVGAGIDCERVGVKTIEAEKVVYCHKLSRVVKTNAQKLARIFSYKDLKDIPIENGRISVLGYRIIYQRVIELLKEYVTKQLSEVIQPSFDFPEIVFAKFYLPRRHKGLSVLELAPIALSVETEDRDVDVVLTPSLLDKIEEADRQIYEEEKEFAAAPR